jgi:hypothetical protein
VVHRTLDAIGLDTLTTEGDIDGVAFHLLVEREDADSVLVIDTNQLKLRIPVRELVDYRRAFRTESGDMVGISAFLVRAHDAPAPDHCLRAHIRGHWSSEQRGLAHFRGLVYTPNGRVAHAFGRAANGRFGGKIVDASSGEFIALMGGSYDSGEFRGRVRGRNEHGYVQGRYGHADRRQGGWFAGRILLCRDDATTDEPEPSDLPPPRPLPEDTATSDGSTTDRPADDASRDGTTDASRTDASGG